jgi:GT2 family glycosyltransferase
VLEFVSATRLDQDAFWEKSALGLSLKRLEPDARWAPRVAFANRRGLPEVFNERIDAKSDHDILVFIHDDVWIDDFFVTDHLIEALDEFHVVGVAGNKRRVPRQPGWLFIAPHGNEFVADAPEHRSGGIAHGVGPCGDPMLYGETPAACELLDGVFMAARRGTLLERGLRFDARFRFHFYDLDFCRSARALGLRVGTWPIALTHQSGGGFDSDEWRASYAKYLEKWKD